MKVLRWIDNNLEEVILIILLICMVCVMGIQVGARYIFNQSLSWSEELTQYMFVWGTFISVSYCVKKRISIKIEQFINILPEKGKTILRLFRHSLVFVFCIVMLPYCVTYVQQAIDSQATSSALQLPLYYIQSAPLVGFSLLTIRVAQAWWREFKNLIGKGEKKAAEAVEGAETAEAVEAAEAVGNIEAAETVETVEADAADSGAEEK